MAVAPNDAIALAERIREMYANAELVMLARIKKAMEGGDTLSDSDWKNKKLAEARQVQAELAKIIKNLQKGMPMSVYQIMEYAYMGGVTGADIDISNAGEDGGEDPTKPRPILAGATVSNMSAANVHAVEVIAQTAVGQIQGAHDRLIGVLPAVYQSVISDATTQMAIGAMARGDAVQLALDHLANKGVVNFIDKNGNKRDLASYADMAVRTGIAHAHVDGAINRFKEYGQDLVYVSDHKEECDTCRPWEGKILSISGNDDRYKSVSEARGAGLWHPNCGHKLYAYYEGFSEPPENTEDNKGYDLRMKQRSMERNVRQWKKRQAVAATPKAKALAEQKVKDWQKALREFTKKHDRRRHRDREQIRVGGDKWKDVPPIKTPPKGGPSSIPSTPKPPAGTKLIKVPDATPLKTQDPKDILYKELNTTNVNPILHRLIHKAIEDDDLSFGDKMDIIDASRFVTRASDLPDDIVAKLQKYKKTPIKKPPKPLAPPEPPKATAPPKKPDPTPEEIEDSHRKAMSKKLESFDWVQAPFYKKLKAMIDNKDIPISERREIMEDVEYWQHKKYGDLSDAQKAIIDKAKKPKKTTGDALKKAPKKVNTGNKTVDGRNVPIVPKGTPWTALPDPVDPDGLVNFNGVNMLNRTRKTKDVGKGFVKAEPDYAKATKQIKDYDEFSEFLFDWGKSVMGEDCRPKMVWADTAKKYEMAGGSNTSYAFNRGNYLIAMGPERTKGLEMALKYGYKEGVLTRLEQAQALENMKTAVHELIHSWSSSVKEHQLRRFSADAKQSMIGLNKEEGLTEFLAKQYIVDFADAAGFKGIRKDYQFTSNRGRAGSYSKQTYLYELIGNTLQSKGLNARSILTNFKLNTYKDASDYATLFHEELGIPRGLTLSTIDKIFETNDASMLMELLREAK